MAKGVFESFDKEVVTPNDALIHAQFFVVMINSAFENALPAFRFVSQVLFAERAQNAKSGVPVEMALNRVLK